MSGASSSLAERGEQLGAGERRALADSIFRQSRDMAEVMGNVLQMTRLETGAIALERDWDSLAEIAGSALERAAARLAQHRLMIDLPPDLPLVRVDAILIEQVLGNLLENAARHTPACSLRTSSGCSPSSTAAPPKARPAASASASPSAAPS
jgi:two-component system sensor histidine kinase KdpD